jgi:hypothetical protein
MRRFKSSTLGLIFCGQFEDIFTPWIVDIDEIQKTITVHKRNWYLIGIDVGVYKLRGLRSILIDNKIYGSNLTIKVFYNSIIIKGLNNSDAKTISEMLNNLK